MMIDAFNDFGGLVEQHMEMITSWEIKSGMFDFSGRDLGFFIMGFLVCLILWGMFDGKKIKWKKRR